MCLQYYAHLCVCLQYYAHLCVCLQYYAHLCVCLQYYAHLCVCLQYYADFLSVCVCTEIELYPPELTVMDCNLTMVSCVSRFNSNETEPSIYFRYNEIWMTLGFNYKQLTNDGLSRPHKVPCPPLYADNRSCMAFLMYVIGTPKINGSRLMCTALLNGTRTNSTTVTIKVMNPEGNFAF